MLPSPVSDFRLYASNSLEVLAGLLAQQLRWPVPGQPLLAPEVVLIPQAAMRRWLQATLAAAHGVAANLEFLTPGEFVARALDANVGKAGDELESTTMHWRLYAALTNPAVMAAPALAALRAYMSGGDALKPWALAGELAAVFEKYQAWRRDWLLRWESGADPNDPQAALWRHVAQGRAHRARRIEHYLNRFAGQNAAPPKGLPKRVFAFATLNVSPDVLRVLATQARAGTMHFYLPTPTRAYWGDLQTLAARLRSGAAQPFGEEAAENPLLQAWGAAGRDFMAKLGSYEVVHPSGEIDAYLDPEACNGGESGLANSLLHRLQADMFYRRGGPSGPLRQCLDKNDPSLQIHAAHTRLRELQVLHDQLRGLLDDPRFDPPLQLREIAVLAPDIDPYVPYLEPVFGNPDQGERMAYALADTSPLVSEPLAEVFVRLLNLPVSRLGLNETLDLLACPALAEATGLDAAALERLHGWLQQAGARWGLDAHHRAQQGAPADDAYTWSFALDRLLLGYASGSDQDIGRVAPWPVLDGGALDALDVLIGLLRVLARYQHTLSQAMPPQVWRERLLGLLEAMLPKKSVAPAIERTLERLHRLIDDFSRTAQAADYTGDVPAQVVRAHMAAVLSQADTRAPLLTGGISVGRMVPMRLLPFRVVCLLGMNADQFPCRDPAAGLNRLTAELGTSKRRHGDRSTREDDRFLFLQLLASAQEVFYLSYLGADPRDGSVREPSVLVTELIAVAARYHSDPPAAEQAMTVRHALQPFAPAAFGTDGDCRQFSYRQQWQPAASCMGRGRQPLPAWFTTPLPALETRAGGADVMTLEDLRRFLVHPVHQFLRQRLGLRLAEVTEASADVEPLLMPGHGPEASQLQRQVFHALLKGPTMGLYEKLRARALLPSGPVGRRQLEALVATLHPYASAFLAWRGTAECVSKHVQIDLDQVCLCHRFDDLYAENLVHVRCGAMNGSVSIRQGLDWLMASAAGLELPLVQFHERPEAGIGPFVREPIAPDQARTALQRLLTLRHEGLQTLLPFGPYSGWKYFSAHNADNAIEAASKQWHGGEHHWGEGRDDPAYRLALRGRDLFNEPNLLAQFAQISFTIFSAVEHGAVHTGFQDGRSFSTKADLGQESR